MQTEDCFSFCQWIVNWLQLNVLLLVDTRAIVAVLRE